eukprot:GHVO01048035.1.p1 GENE.GHVO01048035.1~~GHVO01048035.1.p1  ORF type:complete len:103 (-),score=8.10 GHVO01048035.1:155-463(-)
MSFSCITHFMTPNLCEAQRIFFWCACLMHDEGETLGALSREKMAESRLQDELATPFIDASSMQSVHVRLLVVLRERWLRILLLKITDWDFPACLLEMGGHLY